MGTLRLEWKTVEEADLGDVTFEDAFAELEQLVRQLDEGNLALDEAVSLYERAQTLARYCQQCLDQAELRVTQLESEASE
jgi:exodeoxyribonuclease VII small subunit